MEKNSQRMLNLINKRFSDILSDGFKLFLRHYRTLILPLAIFQILVITFNILLLTDLKVYLDSLGISFLDILDKMGENTPLTGGEWNLFSLFFLLNFALIFLQNLIGAIIITIAMCSVSNYLYNKQMQIDVSFFSSFKSAFNRKIFIVILILGIFLPLGSFLLMFPSIIIFAFFIFLVFTYNIEGAGKPISEARNIAKGAFWKVIGVFIFNFIFIFVASSIYNIVLDLFLNPSSVAFSFNYNLWLSTRNYPMLILYQILINLVNIILAPLFICLSTSLFATLKTRKDLGLIYQRTRDPIHTRLIEELPRIYCPYCGVFIPMVREFCPRCGENLSFMLNNDKKE
ncbi:hypothetical protein LCGC14_0679360 [marine sediment metagenome]|uniref:Glycerophosphoryl diester phosphodiesterase membrane domain-containing protein n=1 Tax=marine sediment metagenome TaxID=412755 RepID=A0A0F9TWQ2_9ZZZZ|nr:MAG: hypothetical protein Lokiarch_33180 [Candidatus Lokiarchaeum sp. GC14_75]